MSNKVLNIIKDGIDTSKKSLAVLLDPDKLTEESLLERIANINKYQVDFVFVGGSLISSDQLDFVLKGLRKGTQVPIVIFPGNGLHINKNADAILLLSLISGRNPEFLIGQHVISAPILKRSGLEILPTGYILVDGGQPTTVSYISNTMPVPNNKPDVAACTAMAGEMLGLRLIYLDAGSGAKSPVNPLIIKEVKKQTTSPLIVGGGINTRQKAEDALKAGADIIVIGNAIEENPDFVADLANIVQNFNAQLA